MNLHAVHPVLPRLLDHLLAFCGRSAAPLFAQEPAPLGRQVLETPETLPHRRLLVGRERLKPFPPLTQHPPLVGGQ